VLDDSQRSKACGFNRFDFFGIYVVMFLEILKTLLQVITVFSVLIVAFGFSFFILLSTGVSCLPTHHLFSLIIEKFVIKKLMYKWTRDIFKIKIIIWVWFKLIMMTIYHYFIWFDLYVSLYEILYVIFVCFLWMLNCNILNNKLIIAIILYQWIIYKTNWDGSSLSTVLYYFLLFFQLRKCKILLSYYVKL